MKPRFIIIDYETFSLLNLKEVGLDNYSKHPSTGVSMLGWVFDLNEDVRLWFPHLGPMPAELADALRDPDIIKISWNVAFERAISKHVLHIDIPIEQWRDPIILARNLSLPGKLEDIGPILKMKELKDPRGNELKEMFCLPVEVKKKKDTRTLSLLPGEDKPFFRTHVTHPKEFAEYCEYCKQDVRTEQALWFRLSKVHFPETQWRGWFLDQKINEFGMPGNHVMAEKALRLALRFIAEQKAKLKDLTKLDNPNSDTQMKKWAHARGWALNTMRAPVVDAELKNPLCKITDECREALKLRKSARKSSYTKLARFLSLLSTDTHRLCYQFGYMGAGRTGRWKSGGKEEEADSMQVQNLPRGEKAVKKKLELSLKLIENEDYEGIKREFTDTKDPKDSITVVEFVCTMLRSLFQAKEGNTLVVADKNAIENRMLGWAAGCPAILDVFRTCNSCGHFEENATGLFVCSACGHTKHRDPYISFGTKLFDKSYAQMWEEYIKELTDDRQNAKPAVLGAGYGLGGGELFINSDGDEVRGGMWGYAKNVCGVDMPKELAHKAVDIFRDSYPEVTTFWTDLEEAFKQVLRCGGEIKVGEVTWDKYNQEWIEHPTHGKQCVLTFRRHEIEGGGYIVSIELPSGRRLHYYNATVDSEVRSGISKKTGKPYSYTAEVIHYDGIEHSATQDSAGKTLKKKMAWGRVKTYGGKICENVIQAMSRDDLLESMMLADRMGFLIWGLFHDELAAEVAKQPPLGEELTLKDLIWCMVQVPWWAPGLLLGAEGYESPVYKKG